MALVDLFKTLGIQPVAMAGHSSGEVAVAYTASNLSKKEAILAAYFREYVTRKKLADGIMAALSLGAEAWELSSSRVIQLALMVGAKIFATVDNEEKVQYLMETFGLSREQIFDSHSNHFIRDVMKATKGLGIDIALNSLAGELLCATWGCFAPMEVMIEIGKRDFDGHVRIDMYGFNTKKAFYGLDARHMQATRPRICGQMLRECAKFFEQGHVTPIHTHL
ncbi:hypothetical protein S40285_06400 [Stachybotrys chlorohalonatus IBT 40285]|uniref:Enoyl reductase (ER) domain-containing protein n=1 Tax=Stachybotrys chlorohalonatus (strain IBT 40285) TaxID=1283841 RepID=A0A084QGH1_STAC4|nr:hypothetical protein S40285_06400 [Stachybotrys chlorohalonata IBT 40285]